MAARSILLNRFGSRVAIAKADPFKYLQQE
jgi:hypothetical protein